MRSARKSTDTFARIPTLRGANVLVHREISNVRALAEMVRAVR